MVTTEEYDEYLDERYGNVDVMGLSYSTSRVLKAVDPSAYNKGFSNWSDPDVQQ